MIELGGVRAMSEGRTFENPFAGATTRWSPASTWAGVTRRVRPTCWVQASAPAPIRWQWAPRRPVPVARAARRRCWPRTSAGRCPGRRAVPPSPSACSGWWWSHAWARRTIRDADAATASSRRSNEGALERQRQRSGHVPVDPWLRAPAGRGGGVPARWPPSSRPSTARSSPVPVRTWPPAPRAATPTCSGRVGGSGRRGGGRRGRRRRRKHRQGGPAARRQDGLPGPGQAGAQRPLLAARASPSPAATVGPRTGVSPGTRSSSSARVLNEPGFQQALADVAGAQITDTPEDIKRTLLGIADYFNKKLPVLRAQDRDPVLRRQGFVDHRALGRGPGGGRGRRGAGGRGAQGLRRHHRRHRAVPRRADPAEGRGLRRALHCRGSG